MDAKRKLDDAAPSKIPFKRFVAQASPPTAAQCDKLLRAVCNQNGVRGKLIINTSSKEGLPLQTLQNSLTPIFLSCKFIQDPKTLVHVLKIGNEEICSLKDTEVENKQQAKHDLAKIALELLKKDCFTLHNKKNYTDVTETDLKDGGPSQEGGSDFNQPGSYAHKMMMKMGWGGAGLGAKEQGRVENVQVFENIERRGLGNKNILKEVTRILKEFAESNKMTTLAFDPTFTKEEREAIHKTARRHNLKSKSEGKDDNRRITVSRKINRFDLIAELIKNECENQMYKLEIPENFKHILNE